MIAIKHHYSDSHQVSTKTPPPGMSYAENDDAPVVHIVDADEDARRLSSLLGAMGMGSRRYLTLDEFLSAEPQSAAGCLVVDADLMRRETRDPSEAVQSSELPCPIVVMARGANVPTAVLAMKSGAIDFVEKPLSGPGILDAIEAAIRIDRKRRDTDARAGDLRARFGRLSRREQLVMALVTAGLLNKQIGGRLGVSEITVKVHRRAVMRKMDVPTLADLVRAADAIGEACTGLARQ